MSRILALILGAGSVALGLSVISDGNSRAGVALAIFGVLVTVLVAASYFRRTDYGVVPSSKNLSELRKSDLTGLAPWLVVGPTSGDQLLSELIDDALSDPEERSLLRLDVRDVGFGFRCLLVVTNRRYMIYRVQGFGVGLALRSASRLIHRIPFGGLIMWPFEGIGLAWVEVSGSERRAMDRVAAVRDAELLSGSTKWKVLREHSFQQLAEDVESLRIEPSWWSGGFTATVVAAKLRKALGFTDVRIGRADHAFVAGAMLALAAPRLEAAGWSVTVDGPKAAVERATPP